MGPTWGPPGSCRPQMGPVLAPWTLLSEKIVICGIGGCRYDNPYVTSDVNVGIITFLGFQKTNIQTRLFHFSRYKIPIMLHIYKHVFCHLLWYALNSMKRQTITTYSAYISVKTLYIFIISVYTLEHITQYERNNYVMHLYYFSIGMMKNVFNPVFTLFFFLSFFSWPYLPPYGQYAAAGKCPDKPGRS